MPTCNSLARSLGMGAGSPDYLEGNGRRRRHGLNAKKSKFAAFFNRIKQAVRDEWHPDEILGRQRPTLGASMAHKIASHAQVPSRADGRIDKLKVVRRLGRRFSRRRGAVSLFAGLRPVLFANPPAGLPMPTDLSVSISASLSICRGRTSFRFYKYRTDALATGSASTTSPYKTALCPRALIVDTRPFEKNAMRRLCTA